MATRQNFGKILQRAGLAKCPTGIQALDEFIEGDFLRGRPTRVYGAVGSGNAPPIVRFYSAASHGTNNQVSFCL